MPESERREGGSLLGAVAYILVPGERRKQAAGHFRKAGFEALRGVAALAKPEKSPESSGPPAQATHRDRMKNRPLIRESAAGSLVKGRALGRVTEFVRRETRIAFPAAKRAGAHAARVFLKKFSEEYARERRKR